MVDKVWDTSKGEKSDELYAVGEWCDFCFAGVIVLSGDVLYEFGLVFYDNLDVRKVRPMLML